jgi:nucleotide-binding universal stress UspA family protein
MADPSSASPVASAGSVFAHVLVGVDGTEAGYEACRQAAVLVGPEGVLDLVAVVDTAQAALAGFSASRLADELESEAAAALASAAELAGGRGTPGLVHGPAAGTLLRELERTEATLAAVGTHGHTRASEILLGGVAGELLHFAPCSVLVARPPASGRSFPSNIVAGVDGSPSSERALATAELLAHRFGAGLKVVVALRGKHVDLARVRLRTPFAHEADARPADALCDAAAGADLLLVGSRGLHGPLALGSVSERVAHRAGCSVLVVRQEA